MIILNVQTFPNMEARHPLKSQRIAADLAQQRAANTLRGRVDAVSRSHSYGVSAVAVSDRGPIGLDVELASPDRPWADVLKYIGAEIEPQQSITHQTGCRVWTLYEAWYKAFGDYPDAHLLNDWAKREETAYGLSPVADSVFAWRGQLKRFDFSIVWRGAPQEIIWLDQPD